MIRVRSLRFATMVGVSGAAAVSLWLALPVLRLGIAQTGPDTEGLEQLAREGGTLAPLARKSVPAPEDAQANGEQLRSVLSAAPLESADWLELSRARLAAGGSMDQVASALALSSLTGPNEQRIMAGRALFGIPFWATLPPESRRSITSDLVGGWAAIDEPGRQALQAAFSIMPKGTREAIKAALLLAGKAGATVGQVLFPSSDGSS